MALKGPNNYFVLCCEMDFTFLTSLTLLLLLWSLVVELLIKSIYDSGQLFSRLRTHGGGISLCAWDFHKSYTAVSGHFHCSVAGLLSVKMETDENDPYMKMT